MQAILNSRVLAKAGAPKRLPFLHPNARSFDQARAMARSAANPHIRRSMYRASRGAHSELPKLLQQSAGGPKAPEKVKRALSGADPGETISRIGRATRRQSKEFSATVHPISGRVMDMRRGGPLSTPIHPLHTSPTRTRAAHLAQHGRTADVRERAARVATGEAGPVPILVHNHPDFTDPHTGHTSTRHYPSGTDLKASAQLAHGHGRTSHVVVVSHQPGPRGAKKTMATHVMTDPHPDTDRVDAHLERMTEHDLATQTKAIRRKITDPDLRHAQGAATAQVRRSRHQAGFPKVNTMSDQHKVYDAGVRHATTGEAGHRIGQHTRQSLHKRHSDRLLPALSAFGIQH